MLYWVYGKLAKNMALWGYFLFLFHLLRDTLQYFKVDNFITTMFVKADTLKTPFWYWIVFNTITIAVAELGFAWYSLKENSFGITGYLTIFLAIILSIAWLYYWFVL